MNHTLHRCSGAIVVRRIQPPVGIFSLVCRAETLRASTDLDEVPDADCDSSLPLRKTRLFYCVAHSVLGP